MGLISSINSRKLVLPSIRCNCGMRSVFRFAVHLSQNGFSFVNRRDRSLDFWSSAQTYDRASFLSSSPLRNGFELKPLCQFYPRICAWFDVYWDGSLIRLTGVVMCWVLWVGLVECVEFYVVGKCFGRLKLKWNWMRSWCGGQKLADPARLARGWVVWNG